MRVAFAWKNSVVMAAELREKVSSAVGVPLLSQDAREPFFPFDSADYHALAFEATSPSQRFNLKGKKGGTIDVWQLADNIIVDLDRRGIHHVEVGVDNIRLLEFAGKQAVRAEFLEKVIKDGAQMLDALKAIFKNRRIAQIRHFLECSIK